MKKKIFKIKLSFLTFLFISLYSVNSFAQSNGFSGSWLISQAKSDFGGQQPSSASYRLVLKQDDKSLKIESFSADADATPTASITYTLDGAKITKLLPSRRTITSYMIIQNNGKTILKTSTYSLADKPETKEYEAKETWYLSDDGRILHVDRILTLENGSIITLKLWYDKQ
jgi:hypothetical protein